MSISAVAQVTGTAVRHSHSDPCQHPSVPAVGGTDGSSAQRPRVHVMTPRPSRVRRRPRRSPHQPPLTVHRRGRVVFADIAERSITSAVVIG